MKFTRRELGLVALVFATTYTITSTGVNAYAGYEVELESQKYMEDLEMTFNEDVFTRSYQEDATYNTLDAFTTQSAVIDT